MPNPTDTTNPASHLIAAKKVQGATVYNTALETLGTIQDVMIDKASGRIAYAILSHGGFLGIGDRYYPLPWEKLGYNLEIDGYIVDIDRETLAAAPSYTDAATASWHDKDWGRQVCAYHGTRPFWDIMP